MRGGRIGPLRHPPAQLWSVTVAAGPRPAVHCLAMSRQLKPLREVLQRAVAAARLRQQTIEQILALPRGGWDELVSGRRVLRYATCWRSPACSAYRPRIYWRPGSRKRARRQVCTGGGV